MLLYWHIVTKRKKQTWVDILVEFLKAQIAGNVLFFSTMFGFFIGDKLLHAPEIPTLIASSVVANVVFFIINKELVFTSGGKQRSVGEIYRFIALMTFNMFIYTGLTSAIASGLSIMFIEGPAHEHRFYLAQIAAAMIFSVWTYIGLKFWVFAAPTTKHRMRTSHHHALTLEKRRRKRA